MRAGQCGRVLTAMVLGGVIAGAATGQPVQWSIRPAPNGGTLASDGAGHVYVGGLTKLDAAGGVVWSTPPPRWPCEFTVRCGNNVDGWAVDAIGAYLAVNGAIGPMQCPLGCGGGNLFLQPAAGGTAVSLFATPFTQPPSAGLAGVTVGAQGELLAVGHDATGGHFVRLRPTLLEGWHGARLTAGAVDASGAILVSGTTGASGFVRRYGATGDVQWTVATSAPNGCGKLIVDASGRVACLSRSEPGFGIAAEWRGVVDLYAASGMPVRMALATDVNDLAFDDGGVLWTAGVACGGTCAALRKHDSAGALLAAAFDSDPGRWSAWLAIAAAATGEVYVTGLARPAPAPDFMPSDMVTARFDAGANRLWQAEIDGAAHWNDFGVSVLATADGVVVSGALTESGIHPTTPLVLKYGARPLAVPAFSLLATPDPAQAGQTITAVATVSGSTAPTGSVTFGEGVTTLCAAVPLSPVGATSAAATCAFAAPTAGVRTLRAVYSGDGMHATAVASVVVAVLDSVVAEVPAVSSWSLALVAALLAWMGSTATARRLSGAQRGPRGRAR